MPEMKPETRAALLTCATSTLTGALNKRGFKNLFLQNVHPVRLDMPRMVGYAYTLRFIPAREDKTGTRGTGQVKAMEECPPGHVLVIDSRGDARAASAGDLYIGRLAARGCAGIVTDGGFRDSEGIMKTGLPAYHQRPSSPPSPIVHLPLDIGLPIACGGVAVYPGDVVVGDVDGVVIIPPEIADEVAAECAETTLYETFAEEEVAKGRSLVGLFPAISEQAKADFAVWRKQKGV